MATRDMFGTTQLNDFWKVRDAKPCKYVHALAQMRLGR
eukprot:SAG11_NODE_21193_length_430_cov_0.649547_1_plen_37_part_10